MPQRTFKGTCTLWGANVDKRRSTAHYITCARAHDLPTGRDADLLIIRVGAVGAAEYGLDVEAGAGAALSNLDAFLRRARTVRSYAMRTRADHECGDETFLPVVNSPRMGGCGYAG